jgi:hypothetical protein
LPILWDATGRETLSGVFSIKEGATPMVFLIEIIVARMAKALAISGAQLPRSLRQTLQPYRPERHYMRGPGPKWRAKHGSLAVRSGLQAGM